MQSNEVKANEREQRAKTLSMPAKSWRENESANFTWSTRISADLNRCVHLTTLQIRAVELASTSLQEDVRMTFPRHASENRTCADDLT